MIKFNLFLALLLWNTGLAHSQNLDQQVLSTAGDDTIVGDTQLSWTLGQIVASHSTNNSIFLTEGFNQSEVIIIALGASIEKQIVTIYPNPTADFIAFKSSITNGLGSYQLRTIKGELLYENVRADFSQENRINMLGFSSGLYLLTIQEDYQSPKQFKIIKK